MYLYIYICIHVYIAYTHSNPDGTYSIDLDRSDLADNGCAHLRGLVGDLKINHTLASKFQYIFTSKHNKYLPFKYSFTSNSNVNLHDNGCARLCRLVSDSKFKYTFPSKFQYTFTSKSNTHLQQIRIHMYMTIAAIICADL